MIEHIAELAQNALQAVKHEAKILVRKAERTAIFVAVLLVLSLLGACGVIALLAAGTLSLATMLGWPLALAAAGGSMLACAFIGYLVARWWYASQTRIDDASASSATLAQQVAPAGTQNAEPAESGMPKGESIADLGVILAAAAAATAILGPRGVLKLASLVKDSLVAVNSLLLAGDLARTIQSMMDLYRDLTTAPPSGEGAGWQTPSRSR